MVALALRPASRGRWRSDLAGARSHDGGDMERFDADSCAQSGRGRPASYRSRLVYAKVDTQSNCSTLDAEAISQALRAPLQLVSNRRTP